MMLMLLIVTSSLVIASFGEDVDFSLGEPCFSKDGSMILTAEYTGSGTVTAVQWYYSGQSANNLVVLAGTCNVFGGVPAGYPDISRMTFDCNANTFTLTLRDLKNDDFGKTWGATFNLAVGSSPDVQSDNLTICLNCLPICKTCTLLSAVFGGLGIIILAAVIILTLQKILQNKAALLLLIGIAIVLPCIISLGLGAGVLNNDDCVDCKDDDDEKWVITCSTAFVVISSLGAVCGIIMAFLIAVDAISLDGNEEGGPDGPDGGHNCGGAPKTHSRVHAGHEETHRGSLSNRADSDSAVSRQDVHVQENQGHLSGRPMPAIPPHQGQDKKGRGLSANFDDDHPMISISVPEKKAGDLGPLHEEPQKKKKKKKKRTDEEYDEE